MLSVGSADRAVLCCGRSARGGEPRAVGAEQVLVGQVVENAAGVPEPFGDLADRGQPGGLDRGQRDSRPVPPGGSSDGTLSASSGCTQVTVEVLESFSCPVTVSGGTPGYGWTLVMVDAGTSAW